MSDFFKFKVRPKFDDYLIDKIEVNFWKHFSKSQLRLSYNEDGQFFVRIPGLDLLVIIRDREAGPMLMLTCSFNANDLLREELKKRYSEEYFDYESTSGENYLTPKLRRKLEEDGVTIKELRGIAFDLLFKEIERVREEVRAYFLIRFNAKMFDHQPHMSLRRVEICYDMLSPKGVELARRPEVQRGFAATVVEHSHGTFINNKGDTTLPGSVVTSSEPIQSENGRYVLKLKYADEIRRDD